MFLSNAIEHSDDWTGAPVEVDLELELEHPVSVYFGEVGVMSLALSSNGPAPSAGFAWPPFSFPQISVRTDQFPVVGLESSVYINLIDGPCNVIRLPVDQAPPLPPAGQYALLYPVLDVGESAVCSFNVSVPGLGINTNTRSLGLEAFAIPIREVDIVPANNEVQILVGGIAPAPVPVGGVAFMAVLGACVVAMSMLRRGVRSRIG